uniref:Uncharacterized protein n=1 Tax=Arundo donax TaxID=35708 RepID=A0A0A9GI72_ARUDO
MQLNVWRGGMYDRKRSTMARILIVQMHNSIYLELLSDPNHPEINWS